MRSVTSKRSRRRMYGGVTSLYASHRSSLVPRRISSTSRKLRVVTIAAASKRRVISAFVATVVPWENSETSDELDAARLDAGHHPLHRVRRGARDLRDVHTAAVLVEDEHVGEGPADVDGYTKSWHARLPTHLRPIVPQRRRAALGAARALKKPAASYSPGPFRAKYHRR